MASKKRSYRSRAEEATERLVTSWASASPAQVPARPSLRERGPRNRGLQFEQAYREARRRRSSEIGGAGRPARSVQRVVSSAGVASEPGDFARDEPSMTPREQARFDREQAQRWRDRTAAENKRRGIPSLSSMRPIRYFDRAEREMAAERNVGPGFPSGSSVVVGGRVFGERNMSPAGPIRPRNVGTLANAYDMAGRVARNNERRGRLLGLLKEYGLAGSAGYKEIAKFHQGVTGAELRDSERKLIAETLLPAMKASIEGNLDKRQRSAQRIYSGPMTRAGIIAKLESEKTGKSWREGLQGVPFGGVVQRGFMDDVQESAGRSASAAAQASGGRGYYGGRSRASGGTGQLRYNGSVSKTGSGITGSEKMTAVSSGGGGWSDGLVPMGGSSAASAVKAYTGILRAGRYANAGGRYLGNDSAGAPMFEKSTYGGFEQTSAVEKDWRHRQSQIDSARTKLYNDWVASSGEYELMRAQQRLDASMNRRNAAIANRVRDQMAVYDRLAREVGAPIETFSVPKPEVAQSSQKDPGIYDEDSEYSPNGMA